MTETPREPKKLDAETKLMRYLTMKERIDISRRIGAGFRSILEETQYDDEFSCNVLYIAARRLNRDDITWEFIYGLTNEEVNELTREFALQLGYEDDADEAVPLVTKKSTSGTKSAPKTSTTSGTSSSAQEAS